MLLCQNKFKFVLRTSSSLEFEADDVSSGQQIESVYLSQSKKYQNSLQL